MALRSPHWTISASGSSVKQRNDCLCANLGASPRASAFRWRSAARVNQPARTIHVFTSKFDSACGRRHKSFSDWTFDPEIPKARLVALVSARFIDAHGGVLLIGPPGVGKSHIATAVAVGAIRAGRRALVRSTFDLAGESRTGRCHRHPPRSGPAADASRPARPRGLREGPDQTILTPPAAWPPLTRSSVAAFGRSVTPMSGRAPL